jgi:hypothetical protein
MQRLLFWLKSAKNPLFLVENLVFQRFLFTIEITVCIFSFSCKLMIIVNLASIAEPNMH